MKIKDYKCKCGHNDFFFADKGNQKGVYCSYCGKLFKWADKDEQNLAMKQEPVLDKIRAEIETQRKEVSNKKSESNELQAFYDGLNDGLKDARGIIDKYRKEQTDGDSD